MYVSGGDDRRVLLWNTGKAISGIQKPFCMKGEHHSNIFCLTFDHENKKIFSGGRPIMTPLPSFTSLNI